MRSESRTDMIESGLGFGVDGPIFLPLPNPPPPTFFLRFAMRRRVRRGDRNGQHGITAWHITRKGYTPIRPAHGRPMKSFSHSLIGTSWTSAERSPPLRANSTIENRHGEVLGCQDLRLADFETRVRPVPSQSPKPFHPCSRYCHAGEAGISGGSVPFLCS